MSYHISASLSNFWYLIGKQKQTKDEGLLLDPHTGDLWEERINTRDHILNLMPNWHKELNRSLAVQFKTEIIWLTMELLKLRTNTNKKMHLDNNLQKTLKKDYKWLSTFQSQYTFVWVHLTSEGKGEGITLKQLLWGEYLPSFDLQRKIFIKKHTLKIIFTRHFKLKNIAKTFFVKICIKSFFV